MIAPIRIAVIGAGPGGLAVIINLLRLDGVTLSVFEGATELREIGAGISINENTWRHLQLLGVAGKIEQYTDRGDGSKIQVEIRNGESGALISRRYQSVDPDKPATSRIERYRLQNALLSAIPEGLIQLRKRLISLKEESNGTTILNFGDGTTAGPFDLIIGADGIRSAVRKFAFPKHELTYTGKTAYRVLIPQEDVKNISGIPPGSCFWRAHDTHVYTNPLDNGLFEIATRAIIPDTDGSRTSWGGEVSKEEVVQHYSGYCETIRQIIQVPQKWLEFSIFGGPRLESVTYKNKIALIGDASHPLSGAFGSGAAFAFEDAYVLTAALRFALQSNGAEPLARALTLYDDIRAPHYKRLYDVLDKQIDVAAQPDQDDDNKLSLDEAIRKGLQTSTQWIYTYDVTKVTQERLADHTDLCVEVAA